MRLPPAILGNAEEVLREILRFMSPADVTLSRYFKDHPRLGGRERGAIAECVYAVLRNKAFFTDFAGAGATMRRLWVELVPPETRAPFGLAAGLAAAGLAAADTVATPEVHTVDAPRSAATARRR